jgi:hypothetical protein
VTTKKAVFWHVAPCRCGVTGRFGGPYRLQFYGRKKIRRFEGLAAVTGESSLLGRVTVYVVLADVSEKLNSSIFRVE